MGVVPVGRTAAGADTVSILATGITSLEEAWIANGSKGTRWWGGEVVPRI